MKIQAVVNLESITEDQKNGFFQEIVPALKNTGVDFFPGITTTISGGKSAVFNALSNAWDHACSSSIPVMHIDITRRD